VETTTTTTPMTLFRKTGKHLTLTIMNQFYSRAAICKLNVRDGSRKCGTVKNARIENAGPPSISRKGDRCNYSKKDNFNAHSSTKSHIFGNIV